VAALRAAPSATRLQEVGDSLTAGADPSARGGQDGGAAGSAASGAAPAVHVALRDIHLSYGSRVIMDGLSCAFPRGCISVLMGGSGSGKSTTLRLIAGLTRPDAGSVCVAGRELVGIDAEGLREVRQRIGMLFQNGALLDSMTVFDNVALPLREHTASSADQIAAEVHRRLEAVALHDIDDLLPGELSGGMLKRAALARAIILDPDILLCDEPFSGLDPPNVLRIEALLTRMCRDLGLTVIVTSHDVATSRRMADQVTILFRDGAVSGSPRDLVMRRDPRIGAFLGVGADGGADAARVEVG